MTTADSRFMAEALRLAERGLYTTDPNPRVGCVLVKNGAVVGKGWHRRAGEDHAEVQALKMAGAAARDAILYINLEPCGFHGRTPPCTQALLAAGVKEVHTAMLDPHPQVAGKGLELLRKGGIAVSIGLLARQAANLNKGFIKRWTQGIPWVRVKLAMSLNGVMGDRTKKLWITNKEARQDVHKWRARSSAVVSSAATVVIDDALLNARLAQKAVEQPLRVLVDTNFRLSPQSRFFFT